VATFSAAELDYLQAERRLARLATADTDGQPQVTPVGMWRYNAELGTIDITGHSFASTRKYRNAKANPKAALVVDDIVSLDPYRPRSPRRVGASASNGFPTMISVPVYNTSGERVGEESIDPPAFGEVVEACHPLVRHYASPSS
jgi:PPOX class F420-dependent enzyme/OxyR family protein